MFGLKIVDIIGISTCLLRILYSMIPLLQILLCCNVGQERFFKRLVTLTEPYSLQTKRAIWRCTASVYSRIAVLEGVANCEDEIL